MMRLRRSLLYAGGGIIFLLLTLLFSWLLVPLEAVEGVFTRAASRAGVVLRVEKLSRSFPPGLAARSMEISDPRGPLLSLRDVRVRPLLLPLLAGKVVVSAEGSIGSGRVSATFLPLSGGGSLDIAGVPLQEVPLLKTAAGADVKGVLTGSGELRRRGKGAAGELRAEVKALDVSGASVGGVPLPAALFDTMRGLVKLSEAGGKIESLTFEGSGLYARISGTIGAASSPLAAPLDLQIELMPQPSFMESQKLVFLLLARYTASPGHYRIPVKGTLARPVVY